MIFLKRIFSIGLLIVGFAFNIDAMDYCQADLDLEDQVSRMCAVDFPYYPYHLNVEQFFVRTQERESKSCGLHALHNAFCFIAAKNKEDLLELLKDDARFGISRELCLAVNKDEDFSGANSYLKVNSLLQALTEHYKIDDNVRNDIMVVRGEEAELLRDIPKGKIKEYENLLIRIRQKRDRFFNGYPQFFIINSNEHWLPFMVTWVSGKVIVWTANSWVNRDATHVHTLERILKLFFME